MFDTHLLLLTMVAVTRGRLPGDPPSAAAGYHGGRHSWNAELSWVPIRTFDRSPPMGTVLTVDRLSLLRRCVTEWPKALYHFRGGALAFSAIPGYSLPCRCGPVSGPANFAFWRVLFFGSLQAPLIARIPWHQVHQVEHRKNSIGPQTGPQRKKPLRFVVPASLA